MPIPSRHAAPLLAAALLALAPRAAHADPTPRTSTLSWVRLPGAEGCIGPRALAIAVERRLRREVFVPPSRAAIAVEGRVERAPQGFRATITVSNEAGVPLGTREIQAKGPVCAAMDEDLALVIALMIDPEAALAPPPKSPPLPLPSPPPRPVPPPQVPAACPAPPSWEVSLQAGGEIMLGLLPRVAGGVLLRSHIEPPRFWGFEVGGVFFPAVEATQGTAGASFQLAEAFLSTCPLTLHAFGAALSACAGVQAGAIHASGFGFTPASAEELGMFNVAVEGRVRRRLWGPLVAGAGLGLVVPTLRTRFSVPVMTGTVTADEVLFTMAPVAGALDLSVGVEFP